MHPSPSHFAMRTPYSVATLRTAPRNSVRTRTDSSSPNSSPNDVKPERSTKANHRSTRTARVSHFRHPNLSTKAHNEGHHRFCDLVEGHGRCETARLQGLEAVVAGFDPM